jgi:hypothetical protein
MPPSTVLRAQRGADSFAALRIRDLVLGGAPPLAAHALAPFNAAAAPHAGRRPESVTNGFEPRFRLRRAGVERVRPCMDSVVELRARTGPCKRRIRRS